MKKIMMLLACLVTVFTLTSCGDAPDDVVTKLYKAMGEGDNSTVYSLCADPQIAEVLIQVGNSFPDSIRSSWQEHPSDGIRGPIYDGNRATVVRDFIDENNQATTESWFLEKVDGQWVIVGAK